MEKFVKKGFIIFFVIYCLPIFNFVSAQKTYNVDITDSKYEVRKGHLNLGGNGLNGESIEVNNFYIERNGKPFIPVIGEFHYCRYPHQFWDEEIKKMKAGGITVLATYVFWNIHEPKEGAFNWEQDLNLKHFIELCKSNNMEVVLRIGPFAHGEIRNGGLPDWLYGRPFEVRSNDPGFLHFTELLYNEIGKQVKGLFFKDGGPIIGVQIENEYQHSAAPWAITYIGAARENTTARRDRKITQIGVGVNDAGNEFTDYGQAYMQNLKSLAKKAGIDAPMYTATGWGFATIIKNGSIPVMAGYAFPFWGKKITPSPFYLFKNIHKNPDYSPVSYQTDDYPSLAAELGTGMVVTYSRRPRVPGESFLPMMVRTIGSGSNGLGYYMYHGGTTPSDGPFMYSEGFGLPLKSYDYQAPIREFGNPGKGFYELKIINNFLNSFGSILAPLYPVIPVTNNDIKASDTTTLRYSVRGDGDKGFIFMHNYQDHVKMVDLKGLKILVKTKSDVISIPENGTFTLKSGASAILPLQIPFGNLTFKYATVQPFCSFKKGSILYFVFISIDGITPEIVVQRKNKITVHGAKVLNRNGNTVISGQNGYSFEFVAGTDHYLVIPFEKALNAYVIGKSPSQYLAVSESLVIENEGGLEMILHGDETCELSVYPKTIDIQSEKAKIESLKSPEKLFSSWKISTEKVNPDIQITQYDDRHFELNARNLDLSKISDVFIKFDYRGDRAVCMLNGELLTDNLYTSEPWQIALKRYLPLLKEKEMYFYFLPMQKDAPYLDYLDKEVVPDFTDAKEFLEIKRPEIIPEFRIKIQFRLDKINHNHL